jgi:alpha-L-fucosidase
VGDPAWEEFYGPAVYCPEFSEENLGKTTEDPYALGASREWLEDWLVRTCELIDRYQPKLLYFDWWIQNHSFKPYLKKLAAYYYNRAVQWGEDVVITYKHEAFAPGVGIFDVERGALTEASPVPWQTDTAIGKQSWGYRADNEYKSARQVICDLVDVVSKNGTLLLNIGPKSDGTFTQEETQVLQDLGDWLRQNGEGIYGTRPWKWCREGEVNNAAGFFRDGDEKPFTGKDFRFTYKDGFLYAFQMRPDGERVTIQTLARKPLQDLLIQSVQSLSTGKPLKFHRDEAGLHIQLTDQPENDLPLGFRIELA